MLFDAGPTPVRSDARTEWWKRPFFCYLCSLIDVGPKKQNWVCHTLLAVKTRSEEEGFGVFTPF
jgi:hypothetical protein